jgi:phosphoenolpyruvate carboxykinase (ATP)
VLPPIARLTPAQAMYHFLSATPRSVAGTEKGMGASRRLFSTCFGAPVPAAPPRGLRPPAGKTDRSARRRLLAGQHRLERRQYGVGKRMSIRHTRALLRAVLDGICSESGSGFGSKS